MARNYIIIGELQCLHFCNGISNNPIKSNALTIKESEFRKQNLLGLRVTSTRQSQITFFFKTLLQQMIGLMMNVTFLVSHNFFTECKFKTVTAHSFIHFFIERTFADYNVREKVELYFFNYSTIGIQKNVFF